MLAPSRQITTHSIEPLRDELSLPQLAVWLLVLSDPRVHWQQPVVGQFGVTAAQRERAKNFPHQRLIDHAQQFLQRILGRRVIHNDAGSIATSLINPYRHAPYQDRLQYVCDSDPDRFALQFIAARAVVNLVEQDKKINLFTGIIDAIGGNFLAAFGIDSLIYLPAQSQNTRYASYAISGIVDADMLLRLKPFLDRSQTISRNQGSDSRTDAQRAADGLSDKPTGYRRTTGSLFMALLARRYENFSPQAMPQYYRQRTLIGSFANRQEADLARSYVLAQLKTAITTNVGPSAKSAAAT